MTLCIYAIIKRFFKSLYKIIELICNNIWIIQNSVVYLYYQRNTNTLLINKLNSKKMTNSTATINGVTFNKEQKAGRTIVTLDETYFREVSTAVKEFNNTLVGYLCFLSKKGKLYTACLHTWGVGDITRFA